VYDPPRSYRSVVLRLSRLVLLVLRKLAWIIIEACRINPSSSKRGDYRAGAGGAHQIRSPEGVRRLSRRGDYSGLKSNSSVDENWHERMLRIDPEYRREWGRIAWAENVKLVIYFLGYCVLLMVALSVYGLLGTLFDIITI